MTNFDEKNNQIDYKSISEKERFIENEDWIKEANFDEKNNQIDYYTKTKLYEMNE